MKNILIIDDNKIDIFVQSRLLKKQNPNYKISSCSNGKSAIKYLSKIAQNNPHKLPDIILLDLNMPIMSGWEFIDKFVHSNLLHIKNMQVFVMSCSLFKDEIQQINKIKEIKTYISKPLSMDKAKQIANS